MVDAAENVIDFADMRKRLRPSALNGVTLSEHIQACANPEPEAEAA